MLRSAKIVSTGAEFATLVSSSAMVEKNLV
jgi:hypothetical protein